ncbi:MAG: carbohydrate kinase family protein [Candidatus Peregrinibacteria bacterium]
MSHLLVTGSLAYDRIAVFKDKFANHILPDKVHRLNVAFTVDNMTIQFGGTGGNIAFNLALLGESPLLLGTVGDDFDDYRKWLVDRKVSDRYIKKIEGRLTAHATIMTDLDDNQITAFHAGAMNHAHEAKLDEITEDISLAIVAPNGIKAMVQYAEACRKKKIPFIADPGQSIPALSKEDLQLLVNDATGLIMNDYEWQLVTEKTGWTNGRLMEHVEWLIITYGEKGSKLWTRDGKEVKIPTYPAEAVVDPTGCGDAFRAGVMYGIKNRYPLEKAAHMGAWVASKALAKRGTQHHTIDPTEWKKFINNL